MNNTRKVKSLQLFFVLLLAGLFLLFPGTARAKQMARIEPKIPDIPGYLTLKCDFHLHTVFSDGLVWPTVRVYEAYLEGLDVISITDHIEYQPFEDDVKKNLNRAHELATPLAKRSGWITLIKGAEITRDMPPGHFNALFLKDSNPLNKENFLDCIQAAADQGAFVYWNHPWIDQDSAIWRPQHTVAYEKGILRGIEVVNGEDYNPSAHRLCIEKKLTMLAGSDLHQPSNMVFDPRHGARRPMTLVFATARSEEAIREALFDRRTAIYSHDSLYGERRFLEPIFNLSVEILNPELEIEGRQVAVVRVRNRSDIPYDLIADGTLEEFLFTDRIFLVPDASVAFQVISKADTLSGRRQLALPFRVANLRLSPEEALPVKLELNVTFKPAEKKK